MTSPCGPVVKAAQVQENFTGGLSDPRWIVDTGTPDTGSGDVSLASDTAVPVRFHWQCPVDLTNSNIFVHAAPDLAVNTYFHFAMVADANNYVSFVVVGPNPGALRLRMCKAGTVTDEYTDYDPTAHAWWRLAEAGGMLRWDSSDHGRSWLNERIVSHGMDLSSVIITFECGAHVLGAGFGGGLFGIGEPLGFGD